MQGYAVGIQNGFMCPNDVRALENMDLIPEEKGGWKYMCNGNMIDISDVGKQYDRKEELKDEQEVLELEEPEDTKRTNPRKNSGTPGNHRGR